ncbi:hypothetical protein ABPG72_019828 [Tetrahymena utriculariae]
MEQLEFPTLKNVQQFSDSYKKSQQQQIQKLHQQSREELNQKCDMKDYNEDKPGRSAKDDTILVAILSLNSQKSRYQKSTLRDCFHAQSLNFSDQKNLPNHPQFQNLPISSSKSHSTRPSQFSILKIISLSFFLSNQHLQTSPSRSFSYYRLINAYSNSQSSEFFNRFHIISTYPSTYSIPQTPSDVQAQCDSKQPEKLLRIHKISISSIDLIKQFTSFQSSPCSSIEQQYLESLVSHPQQNIKKYLTVNCTSLQPIIHQIQDDSPQLQQLQDAGAIVSISRPQLSLPSPTIKKDTTSPPRIRVNLSKATDIIKQINNTLSDQPDQIDEDQVISQLLKATQNIPQPSLPMTCMYLNIHVFLDSSRKFTRKFSQLHFSNKLKNLKLHLTIRGSYFSNLQLKIKNHLAHSNQLISTRTFQQRNFRSFFWIVLHMIAFRPSKSSDPLELPIYNLRCRLYLKGYKFQDSLSNIVRSHETNVRSLLPPKSSIPKEFSQFAKEYDFSRFKEPPRLQQPENALFRQLQNQQMQDLINHRKEKGLQFNFYKNQKN